MRFRAITSKIKYQHSMIKDLRDFLERIEPWVEIQSLIPGRINRTSGTVGRLTVTVQYVTRTGLKCIARRSGTAQEIFIVTSTPEVVRDKLATLAELATS